ncbi:MAG: alpha/beta hydrolase [Flavipsychrobacter sp.]|nr:alpha/beta hydrolase [Flavipsychrobacter sp.]
MAHKINRNEQTGKDSFFSVNERAWHGLGTIVTEYPTSSEALKFAGLDYEVLKRPNIHLLDDGTQKVSKTSFYSYRPDTGAVLGDRLGADYQVVQNVEAFSFFDSIVGGDGIMYETAGALGKGERIFITAKLPDYIKVGKEDLIEKYLFLTTSHDGYGSITAAFTPIRIVCNNTLSAALENCTNTVRIRHTQSAQDRLTEAHKVMGISNRLSAELDGIFNQWAKIRITDSKVKELIQLAMVPNREVLRSVQAGNMDELSTCFMNICDNAYEYAMASPTQQTDTTKGTLFGAYNAITGYFQNVRSYKNEEAKFKSIMDGTGKLRTQAAFDLCMAYAKKGNIIQN